MNLPPAAGPARPTPPFLKWRSPSAAPSLPPLQEEGIEDESYDFAHGRTLFPPAEPSTPSQIGSRSPRATHLVAKHSQTDLQTKTAVFGGSFDPPHWGTAWCIRRLFAAGARDVWLMPADVHADKKGLSPFAVRYQMLLSLKDHMCRVQGVEPERLLVINAEQFVASRGQTLEVLREMTRWYPSKQFVLTVGADVGASLDTWPQAEQLRAEFRPVVLERPGGPWRADLLAQGDESIWMSSTEIRALRRAGASIEACAPPSVVADIERADLYVDPDKPRWKHTLRGKKAWSFFASFATAAAGAHVPTTSRQPSETRDVISESEGRVSH